VEWFSDVLWSLLFWLPCVDEAVAYRSVAEFHQVAALDLSFRESRARSGTRNLQLICGLSTHARKRKIRLCTESVLCVLPAAGEDLFQRAEMRRLQLQIRVVSVILMQEA